MIPQLRLVATAALVPVACGCGRSEILPLPAIDDPTLRAVNEAALGMTVRELRERLHRLERSTDGVLRMPFGNGWVFFDLRADGAPGRESSSPSARLEAVRWSTTGNAPDVVARRWGNLKRALQQWYRSAPACYEAASAHTVAIVVVWEGEVASALTATWLETVDGVAERITLELTMEARGSAVEEGLDSISCENLNLDEWGPQRTDMTAAGRVRRYGWWLDGGPASWARPSPGNEISLDYRGDAKASFPSQHRTGV